jgi:hypothetical protein
MTSFGELNAGASIRSSNCSSVDHVGLAGRYGSFEDRGGDLKAMAIMRDLLERRGG